MRLVRAFEENAVHQGYQSLIKEARMFAEELGFTLDLSFPHPKCRDNTDGAEAPQKRLQWSNGERKAPRSKMGGGPAEPARLLCVAEELGYGAYTHAEMSCP